MTNLLPPTSYQGGKQRLSKNIVDIILKDNKNNIDYKIYDLCCGSGAISLELINRGINPEKIVMCDMGNKTVTTNLNNSMHICIVV
ncbi:DNA adenine methylase [Sutterella wadsworthensis]|uniref:DNA adenine methylase n=1 Tax=Sutterella wadsworthensis TaxID=40545 RepID=UPI0032C10E45